MADGYKVQLYVYDLSQGLAKQFSPMLIGRTIDGIWHTGIVIHWTFTRVKEYYYGGGIQVSNAGQTMAGRPTQVIDLGYTQIPEDVLQDFFQEIHPQFTPDKYNLFHHNCNNFSNEVSKFLLGNEIPSWITGLPQEVLNTPFGQMIRPFIDQFENVMKSGQGGIPWSESNSATSNQTPATTAPPVPLMNQFMQQVVHSPALAQSVDAIKSTIAHANPNAATPSASSASASSVVSVAAVSPSSLPSLPVVSFASLCPADHPHRALSLNVVSQFAKPLLSHDDKAKQFYDMLLKHNATLQAKPETKVIALSDAEKAALQALVDHLASNPKESLAPPPEIAFPVLDRILRDWSVDVLFPVLALFRLFVLRPGVANYYVQAQMLLLHSVIERCFLAANATSSSQLMTLCSVANLLSSGIASLCQDELILKAAKVALSHKSKVLRVMGVNILFNITLVLQRATTDSVTEVLSALNEVVHQGEKDNDVLNRVLSSLGHLIFCSSESAGLLSALEFPAVETFPESLQPLAKDVHAMMTTM